MEIDANIEKYHIVGDGVPSFQKKDQLDKIAQADKNQDVKKVEIKEKNDPKPQEIKQISIENDDKKSEDSKKDVSLLSSKVEIAQPDSTKLQFKVVEETDPFTGAKKKEMVVFLLDSETGKIIRRVPPEELKDSSVGSLIDEIS